MRLALAAGGVLVIAALGAGNYTAFGRLATAYVFVVLNYFIGVVTLVALSLTVMAGLVSTDRILLRIGHRVLLQGVHRATAVLAVVALGVHVAVKVLAGHAALGDVVVPFFSQGRSLFIGFGTVASYLMLLAFWSGLARTRFIRSARPWMWRVLHCSVYPCWLVALAHGLNAGRQAATWVVVSYLACLVGVALALLARVYSRFGRYAPGKTERAPAVGAQAPSMPRFGYAPAPGRAPVPAPVSPVDARPERWPQTVQAGPAAYQTAGQGYADYADRADHADHADHDGHADYAGHAGHADWAGQDDWSGQDEPQPAPVQAYPHDYWAEQDGPRLRLVASNHSAAGTVPRGRRAG